jgi:hypothetical protein
MEELKGSSFFVYSWKNMGEVLNVKKRKNYGNREVRKS